MSTHSTAVTNAAVPSIKGLVYQCCVALDKCFTLETGQSICLEHFGDVSVPGQEQKEVKQFAGNLTDNHENFWKTLNNWLRPEFNEQTFAHLILHTTQEIGPQSALLDWNGADGTGREAILAKIWTESEARHTEKVKQAGSNQPPSIPTALALQRAVMIPALASKRAQVIERFVIASRSPDVDKLADRLRTQYCKGILLAKRDDFLEGLLGYIVSPETIDRNDWTITESEFSAKVAEATSRFCKGTTQFPTKHKGVAFASPPTSSPEARFVQKIKEINYAEVIPQAKADHLYASMTVQEVFAAYERDPATYRTFSEAVLEQFRPSFRKAVRNASGKPNAAKDFYDETMASHVPSFPSFEQPNPSFRNGVLHMHQDDEAHQLTWKL